MYANESLPPKTHIKANRCGFAVAHNASHLARKRRLQEVNTAPRVGVVLLASSGVAFPTPRNAAFLLFSSLLSPCFSLSLLFSAGVVLLPTPPTFGCGVVGEVEVILGVVLLPTPISLKIRKQQTSSLTGALISPEQKKQNPLSDPMSPEQKKQNLALISFSPVPCGTQSSTDADHTGYDSQHCFLRFKAIVSVKLSRIY
ncbi:hypothetical protein LXL04_011809 [Taraxacum kok-saghyz]